MNVLITGANRGLGAGFVQHYLQQGHEVWASYRQDQGVLAELACRRLHAFAWDVCDADAVLSVDLPSHLDVLINNAGVYGPKKSGQSLQDITVEAMLEVFRIDTIAPLMVSRRMLPLLRKGKAELINISSKMGSNADNSSGGTYAYRTAKAGLLMVSSSLAVDLAAQGVHVLALHPGWVQTDMTNGTGLIDVPTSVAGMCQLIDHARDYPSGSFLSYAAEPIPF